MTIAISGPLNSDGFGQTNSGLMTVTWTTTADGSGNASEALTQTITGLLIGFETNPGSPAPTDNYDLTVTNAAGRDVLGGAGADRDTSTTEYAQPKDSAGNVCAMPLIGETLTFAGANMGSGGVTVLKLYIEKR